MSKLGKKLLFYRESIDGMQLCVNRGALKRLGDKAFRENFVIPVGGWWCDAGTDMRCYAYQNWCFCPVQFSSVLPEFLPAGGDSLYIKFSYRDVPPCPEKTGIFNKRKESQLFFKKVIRAFAIVFISVLDIGKISCWQIRPWNTAHIIFLVLLTSEFNAFHIAVIEVHIPCTICNCWAGWLGKTIIGGGCPVVWWIFQGSR